MHFCKVCPDQVVNFQKGFLKGKRKLSFSKVGICHQSFREMALCKLGSLDTAMTIENCKETHSIAVNILVTDVCVFLGETPALHGAKSELIA